MADIINQLPQSKRLPVAAARGARRLALARVLRPHALAIYSFITRYYS